jgi:RNA polymerase primary sigma factor
VERDYHRIRAFDGRGSFGGYILSTVVDHLLIDLVRQEGSRPRLPADIARMSPLHQAIFAACIWGGVALDAERMVEAVRGKIQPEPHPDEVAATLNELAGTIAAARGSLAKPEEISIDADDGIAKVQTLASSALTAEDILLEQEEQRDREALLNIVKREADALPSADRLYLQLVFQSNGPLPPREVAKLMAIPVEDVYRLKQRVERWMKQIALSLQKNVTVSV